jgi:hypothetical protein
MPLFDIFEGLIRNKIEFSELLTKRFWRYRQASIVLYRARYHLRQSRPMSNSDWDASALLIEAGWLLDNEYYERKS